LEKLLGEGGLDGVFVIFVLGSVMMIDGESLCELQGKVEFRMDVNVPDLQQNPSISDLIK
jgi:hypothetical protein